MEHNKEIYSNFSKVKNYLNNVYGLNDGFWYESIGTWHEDFWQNVGEPDPLYGIHIPDFKKKNNHIIYSAFDSRIFLAAKIILERIHSEPSINKFFELIEVLAEHVSKTMYAPNRYGDDRDLSRGLMNIVERAFNTFDMGDIFSYKQTGSTNELSSFRLYAIERILIEPSEIKDQSHNNSGKFKSKEFDRYIKNLNKNKWTISRIVAKFKTPIGQVNIEVSKSKKDI